MLDRLMEQAKLVRLGVDAARRVFFATQGAKLAFDKFGSSPKRVGNFGPIFRFLAACT